MIPFTKMHGIGNDCVVIDARVEPYALDGDQIRLVADRRRGVGCDQLVIAGVAPSRAVVLAVCDEHVEEGVRVEVVTDPSRARDVKVRRALSVEVDLPLFLVGFDAQAELTLPSVSEDLGDVFVSLAGVVVDLDATELFTLRAVACLSDEALGLF